jgi:nicotinamidase-related amidase
MNAHHDLKATTKRALLVIDVQQGFDEYARRVGGRNNPDAETNIAHILAAFRRAEKPVIHVHHASLEANSPLRADASGYAVKPEAVPIEGERVMVKHVNSAFIGTDLEAVLRGENITDLVIVGATTDHCCSTTARMAANLGFSVQYVEDALWTLDKFGADGQRYAAQLVHDVNIASLNEEFVEVTSTSRVIAALE